MGVCYLATVQTFYSTNVGWFKVPDVSFASTSEDEMSRRYGKMNEVTLDFHAPAREAPSH